MGQCDRFNVSVASSTNNTSPFNEHDPEKLAINIDVGARMSCRVQATTLRRVKLSTAEDREASAEGAVQAAGNQHLAVRKERRSVVDASLIQATGHRPRVGGSCVEETSGAGHVTAPAVSVRLGGVATQFGGYDFPRIRVEARYAEVDSMFCVKHANLGALGRRLSLVWLALDFLELLKATAKDVIDVGASVLQSYLREVSARTQAVGVGHEISRINRPSVVTRGSEVQILSQNQCFQ
jgi:hypothetical protein